MISTKSRVSLARTIFLFASRPIGALVAVVPLRISPLPHRLFFAPSPVAVSSRSHIDEFIAGTARAIVTKIVYDIDSSFYVNPVSEWFWSTWRESEHAFCIRMDAHTPERERRQQCRANVCERLWFMRVARRGERREGRAETTRRAIDEFTRKRTDPESHGALSSVMSSLC